MNGPYSVVVFLCLALTIAASLEDTGKVKVVRSNFVNDGSGNYEFWFEQSDGVKRWQTGEIRYNSGQQYIYTTGGYAYPDLEKHVLRIVMFTVDENGYRATYSEEPEPPGGFPARFGQGASG